MNWDGERVFVGVGETKPMAKVMRSPGGWRDQTKPKPKDDAAKGFQTWQQATSDGLQKGLNGFKMVFMKSVWHWQYARHVFCRGQTSACQCWTVHQVHRCSRETKNRSQARLQCSRYPRRNSSQRARDVNNHGKVCLAKTDLAGICQRCSQYLFFRGSSLGHALGFTRFVYYLYLWQRQWKATTHNWNANLN